MKKLKYTLIIWLLLSNSAFALDMAKISYIESRNNPLAYNKNSGARGLYQITNICLKEYNQFNKTKYGLNDLFIAKINTMIAEWYIDIRIPQLLKHFKLPDNDTYRIICYNAGILWAIRYKEGRDLPKETKDYIRKYNEGR